MSAIIATPANTVFISYRRDTSAYTARSIFDHLIEHGFDVFMDVDSIDAGKYEQVIFNQIAARAHFLVVLSHGTTEQWENPQDLMRREVETAMTLGRNVIPILVDDFTFEGAAASWATTLQQLPQYNAIKLYHDYFEAAMERLRHRHLKQPLSIGVTPPPADEAELVSRVVEEVSQLPLPTSAQLTAEEYYRSAMALPGNEYAQRIQYLTEATHVDPTFVPGYLERAIANWHTAEYGRALDDLATCLSFATAPPDALAWRAVVSVARNDLDAAFADCDAAIDLNPALPVAYVHRAMVRFVRNDFAGAEGDCNTALRAAPRFARAYSVRSGVRQALNDLGGSLSDAEEAVRLDSVSYEAYTARASARSVLGNHTGSMEEWNQAIALNPRSASAYAGRGLERDSTERRAALEDLNIALRIDPENWFAFASRAAFCGTNDPVRQSPTVTRRSSAILCPLKPL